MNFTNFKMEPFDEANFLVPSDSLENIGEKCGLIYKTNCSFIYKCVNCTFAFKTIEIFRSHILENHIIANTLSKTGKNSKETDKIQSDEVGYVNDIIELNDNILQIEKSQQEKSDSLSQCIKRKNTTSVRRSVRKRKLCITETNSTAESKKNLEFKKSSKRRCSKKVQWQLDKIFSTESATQDYILSQKIWSFLHKNFTKKGIKRYYRCNRVKFRGQQCASSILYFLNNKTGKCEVYKTNANHTCDVIGALESNSKITTEIKSKIEDLYEKGVKLKDIVNKAEREFNVKSGQVKHFLKLLKIKKEKSLKAEVEKWLKENINLPESSYYPFVVNYESNEYFLRLFISSQSLLSNAINANIINLNGVKKLNWHTYTIFFPGIINESGHFKCFGVAICQKDEVDDFIFIFKTLTESIKKYFNVEFNPRVLFRDSNLNVETAFKNVFDSDVKIKICWSHTRNKLKIKLEYLLPEHHNKKEEILAELDEIQKSRTYEVFKEMIDSFVDKWAMYVEFITYFHQEWVDKNFNWYEGINLEIVSNNNSIEQLIKKIQNDEHFRERLPFVLFKNKFFEWINNLSITKKCDKMIQIKGDKENSNIPIKIEAEVPQEPLMEICKSNSLTESFMCNSENKLKLYKPKGPKTSYKTTISSKNSVLKIPQTERKKRSEKLWKEETIFQSLSEAELAVESEKIWSLSTKNRTKAGTKIYFRCNKVPFRGVQCDACLYLFLKSDSTKVILVRSGLSHNCHEIAFKSRGIDKEIRIEIEKLNDLNWKPSQILDYIREQNYESPPTKIQISNYLAVLRERKYGTINLNEEALQSWLKNYAQVPDNDTKMFIVAHECVNNQHQFFFSSKKLLQNSINIRYIHIDDIHKLEWIKFPIYFIGSSNDLSNFNFLGIAVCYSNEQSNFEFIFNSLKNGILRIFNYLINPEFLITDTNYCIQLAFKNVFNQGKIKICWDIFKKCIRRKLDDLKFSKESNSNILKDLEILQRSTSEIEFNEKLINFLNKWSDENKEFITYLQKEWINVNKNWYQKYDESSILTNTTLETFVKAFKSDQLFRKKMPIDSFNKILNKSIKTWSMNSKI